MIRACSLRGLAAVVSAGLAACSLTTSLDGMTGGEQEGTELEGALPVVETPGSVDAGGADDAPVTLQPGCDPKAGHTFCADFSDGQIASGWSSVGGSLARGSLVTDGGVSAPYALRAVLEPGDYPGIALTKELGGGYRKLSCTVHIQKDVVGDNMFHPMKLSWTTSKGDADIMVIMGAQGGIVQPYVSPTDGGPRAGNGLDVPFGFEPGAFHALRIETDGTTLSVDLDGQRVASGPLGLTAVPLQTQLSVGTLRDMGNSTPWVVRFDDVSCDLKP